MIDVLLDRDCFIMLNPYYWTPGHHDCRVRYLHVSVRSRVRSIW